MFQWCKKVTFSLILWVACAAAQTTVTYSYNGFPAFVAVDSADIITVVSIVVPQALRMTKVTAKVKIDYPQVGDLNVFLYSPDGTRTKLLERNCAALQNVDTTFDDAAPSRYSDFCPSEAGRGPYRGNEPLSNFNGADSSVGVWRLAVENNGSDSRVGWVRDLTLTITGTPQLAPAFRSDTVLSSASLRSGVIAPGQTITILGLGLGPSAGATAPQGAWPTVLSGVRVTINGTDIPLSYVSSYRIDGQVPFQLSTSGPATVQIRNNETASSSVPVNTQATVPAVYTLDQSGIGQAKAINQDGKLNSKVAPAVRGEVITIYASGLGAVAPSSPAGQGGPANPLSLVSQSVNASIGGVPATVLFAGLAPNYVGSYQLNIMVPSGVLSGTREIVISNGGNSSQSLVTVEIQ